MKKGFTLVETVVALAVIGIVTTTFFTLASHSKSVHNKITAQSVGLVQIQNVENIFLGSSFNNNGQFTLQNFQENLDMQYPASLVQGGANQYNFGWELGQTWQPTEKGFAKIKFMLEYGQIKVSLSAEIVVNGKVVYATNSISKGWNNA